MGNRIPFILLLFLTRKFILLASAASEAPFVGVNISPDVSNLLAPADLVSFLKFEQITHIRLYDADPGLLAALSGASISVVLGIPNNQLLALGSSPDTAASWVARYVLPFHPNTPISAVAVGNDVLTALPSALPLLLPALRYLSTALSAANFTHIPVSTPLPASVILDPFPPSQAFFNQSLVPAVLLPLLRFLADTSAPLMLNLYPYYTLVQSRGVVPLDTALFKPLPPAREMVDPNTLLHYTNVLDAMIDAAHFSIRNLNVTATDIPVLVIETGWPSAGDPKLEPFATKDNADTYNSNLIKHVLDRAGTPLRPEVTSSVYIYELFNQALRPGLLSEANWGLFYGNRTPVYLLHLAGSGGFLANDTTNRTFCVAADGADARALQAALDWACGPGRANCSDIQPGEDCYEPNNVKSHASYAFDSYYQKEGKVTGSCFFQGVAMITTTDPMGLCCRSWKLHLSWKQAQNQRQKIRNRLDFHQQCRGNLLLAAKINEGTACLHPSFHAAQHDDDGRSLHLRPLDLMGNNKVETKACEGQSLQLHPMDLMGDNKVETKNVKSIVLFFFHQFFSS